MKVGWKPLPGAQTLALSCPCDRILMHGTRGSGKSEVQLAYFLKHVGRGYGRFWRGIVIDRGYKNLDDLLVKAQAIIEKCFPDAQFLSANSDLKWIFPDGEELLFRHMANAKDYRKYHGHEYPFIAFNELTSYGTSEVYDLIESCNRSSFLPDIHSPNPAKPLPEIPLVIFSTTNPFGPGHNWVKKRFIDVAGPGVPVIKQHTVFNPRTKEEETVRLSQVAIFASYRENPYLSVRYIAFLDSITDPMKRRAWLGGDWSVTSGGALDDLWKPSEHVVERFPTPSSWKLNRSFDWGSTHPFAALFWAEANGEEITLPSGMKWCPPNKSLILVDTVYGVELIKVNDRWVPNYGSNRGLKLSAREVARRINEKELSLVESKWITRRPAIGPADGQIYNNNEDETDSIAQKMLDEGIEWYPASKGPGSRKMGLQLVRDTLQAAIEGENPGLFVMAHNEAFLETVPSIPRDEDKPDEVDTTAEDHIFDALAYRLLDDKSVYSANVPVDFAR